MEKLLLQVQRNDIRHTTGILKEFEVLKKFMDEAGIIYDETDVSYSQTTIVHAEIKKTNQDYFVVDFGGNIKTLDGRNGRIETKSLYEWVNAEDTDKYKKLTKGKSDFEASFIPRNKADLWVNEQVTADMGLKEEDRPYNATIRETITEKALVVTIPDIKTLAKFTNEFEIYELTTSGCHLAETGEELLILCLEIYIWGKE
jgi:hypothetical protein